MPRLYGLFADLSGRQVLVVGGGEVAERKVSSLLKAGASVVVGSMTLTHSLGLLLARGDIAHLSGEYIDAWLQDSWLVVAATDDQQLNQRIAETAESQKILVNVVDDVALSTFHVPAIVDRGALQIAISTAGAAPVVARQLRSQLEAQLDGSWGALVALTARFRQRIKTVFPQLTARRQFFEQLPNGPVFASLRRRDAVAAEQELRHLLKHSSTETIGEVVLVGAGPGDPGLLTLHAHRALQQADVILHDRLVSDEVLDLARRDVEFIQVGKTPGSELNSQDKINALLIDQALQGKRVVRLKGGDPFVFGRGGEELEALREADIAYRVVPGITAAAACSAYAGIPLTHRDYAQSVRFVTAHCKGSIDRLDWKALAQEKQTLAFYMGVSQLGRIQQQLLAYGRRAEVPFALIENGTRKQQRVLRGSLGELARVARLEKVQTPALLVVGEVAVLADSLAWFGEHHKAVLLAQSQQAVAVA